VRRARVRRRDARIDQFSCSSRLFACFASFARTSQLSDSSEAAARTAVRAKSAKIAKAREEQQPQEWWFDAPRSAGVMSVCADISSAAGSNRRSFRTCSTRSTCSTPHEALRTN